MRNPTWDSKKEVSGFSLQWVSLYRRFRIARNPTYGLTFQPTFQVGHKQSH